MKTTQLYRIADHYFQINGERLVQAVARLAGFAVFEEEGESSACPQFFYTDELAAPTDYRLQYEFSSDGVTSTFSSTGDGYLLRMQHDDQSVLQLWSYTGQRSCYIHGSLAPQMLRFALWMAYGIMNVTDGRIPIHGSCIVHAGKAFLFLGESGTGKSTHTRLWRTYIEGSTLLNDDSPIVSVEADGIWIYGSPWSGKTPCYKQEKYPLKGCVRLSQAPFNKIRRLSVLQSYAALHPSCPPEFAYDTTLYEGITESLNQLLIQVPVYHLACLPDEAAARLSYQTLSADED